MLFSGEDTDNQHSEDLDKQNSSKPKPTSIDCTDLIKVAAAKGYKAEQVDATAKKKYKHSLEFITQKEHDEMLDGFNKLPDKP